VEGKVRRPARAATYRHFAARAFCPISQIDIFRCRTPRARGANLPFLITRFEDKGQHRRVPTWLLNRELEAARKQFLETLNAGKCWTARSTRIMLSRLRGTQPGVREWSTSRRSAGPRRPRRTRSSSRGSPAGQGAGNRRGRRKKPAADRPFHQAAGGRSWLSVEDKFRKAMSCAAR